METQLPVVVPMRKPRAPIAKQAMVRGRTPRTHSGQSEVADLAVAVGPMWLTTLAAA